MTPLVYKGSYMNECFQCMCGCIGTIMQIYTACMETGNNFYLFIFIIRAQPQAHKVPLYCQFCVKSMTEQKIVHDYTYNDDENDGNDDDDDGDYDNDSDDDGDDR